LELLQNAVAPVSGAQSAVVQQSDVAMQEVLLQFLSPLPQANEQAPVSVLQVPTCPVMVGTQSVLEQQDPLRMQTPVPQGL